MIEFIRIPENDPTSDVRVKLDGKYVGSIRRVHRPELRRWSWQYFPKGQKNGGEMFDSLDECKADIKGDSE